MSTRALKREVTSGEEWTACYEKPEQPRHMDHSPAAACSLHQAPPFTCDPHLLGTAWFQRFTEGSDQSWGAGGDIPTLSTRCRVEEEADNELSADEGPAEII